MKILFFISIFFLISNCSFNLVDDHHGVYFLEKKEKKITVEESNINDIIEIFGEPSTKSTFDTDVWIYIERKITNTHFFGRRKLIVNNVMVLEIDDRGVLAKKDFYDINDMNNLKILIFSSLLHLSQASILLIMEYSKLTYVFIFLLTD